MAAETPTGTERVSAGTATVLRGSGVLILGKAAQILAGYLVVGLILRFSGAATFGLYAAAGATALFLSSLGSGWFVEIVVRFAGAVRLDAMLREFVLSSRGRLVAGVVVVSLAASGWFVISAADLGVAAPMLAVGAITGFGVCLSVTGVAEAVAQRHSMLALIAKVQLVRSVSLVGATAAALAVERSSVALLLLAQFVAQLVSTTFLIGAIRRSPDFARAELSLDGMLPASNLWRYGMQMVGGKMSSFAVQFADRILLLLLVDAAAAGVYAATYDVFVRGPILLMTAVFESTNGPIVAAWQKGHVVDALSQAMRLRNLMLLLGVLAIGASAALYPLVGRLFDEQIETVGLAVILVTSAGIWAIGQSYQRVLRLTLRSSVVLLAAVSAMVVNIVLNLVLIPSLEAAGAAYATVASILVGAVILVATGDRERRKLISSLDSHS